MKNILMLMMAGKGTRLGADCPKQYIEIDGIPIFAYILYGYAKTKQIDAFVFVVQPEWALYVTKWIRRLGLEDQCLVAAGADERSLSVRNGILAAEKIAEKDDVLLIHDATHPYVDVTGLKEIIRAVHELGAATLAQGEYDTVYRRTSDNLLQQVLPRQEVVSGASPEAFRFGLIADIFRTEDDESLRRMTSAGAIALACQIPMAVVESDVLNLKITYPRDLELMKKLIHTYFFPGIKEEIQERGFE